MTAFLLVGTRVPGGAERSPAMAARAAAALMTWLQGLRRWGLLRSFALPDAAAGAPVLCLIVQVSGQAAAQQLAARWEWLGGYHVTVLEVQEAAGLRAVDEGCAS